MTEESVEEIKGSVPEKMTFRTAAKSMQQSIGQLS